MSGGRNQRWPTRLLHNPCRLGGSQPFQTGGQNQGCPQVGKVVTNPLPLGESPTLPSGGQNQRWPRSAQLGYITPAARVPTALAQGAESEVAHKWAGWLRTSCRLGGPPPWHGGQNQRGPTSGQGGYITLAAWGDPHHLRPGGRIRAAHKWATWLPKPCRPGGPHRFKAGRRIRHGPQVGKVAT